MRPRSPHRHRQRLLEVRSDLERLVEIRWSRAWTAREAACYSALGAEERRLLERLGARRGRRGGRSATA